LIIPFFDEHRLFVRQNALHLVANPDDFEPVTFLDDDFLVYDSIRNNVGDLQSFDFAVLQANHRALVIGGLHRVCHFVQPLMRCQLLRRRQRTYGQQAN
jgi:hypothetical protein